MEKLFTAIYEKLGIPQDYAGNCLNAGTVPAFSGHAGGRYALDLQNVSVELTPGDKVFAYVQGTYFLTIPENERVEPIFLQSFLIIPAGETNIDKILMEDEEKGGFWAPAVEVSAEYIPHLTHILVKPVNGGLVRIG